MGKIETTLVMLPGLDGTGLLFEPFVAALPSDLRVHTIAYPTDTRLSIREHAALVAKDLPTGPVVLLAESFSGLVALTLLREFQISVRKVIFLASFAKSPRMLLRFLSPLIPPFAGIVQAVPESLVRLFCLGPQATAAQVAWLKSVLSRVPPEVIAHRLKLVATAGHGKQPPLDIPAIYIQPAQDRLIPASATEELRKCFREFAILQVRGPHFALQAFPVECASLIARLVQEATDQPLALSSETMRAPSSVHE